MMKVCKICKKSHFEFNKQICSNCKSNLNYILKNVNVTNLYRFAKLCLTLTCDDLIALFQIKRNSCKDSNANVKELRTEMKIISRAYWIQGCGANIEQLEENINDSEEYTE